MVRKVSPKSNTILRKKEKVTTNVITQETPNNYQLNYHPIPVIPKKKSKRRKTDSDEKKKKKSNQNMIINIPRAICFNLRCSCDNRYLLFYAQREKQRE